jgi:hypothetical protein
MFGRSILLVIGALVLAACAAPSRVYQSVDALAPPVEPSVLIIPPDVEISLRTAGGILEPRADWSEEVSSDLDESLRGYMFENDLRFVNYGDTLKDEDVDTIHHLNVVLDAIELRQARKSVGGEREYALGETEIERLSAYGADYALVITLRASRASAGRQAVAFLAAVGGVPVETTTATFRAALIDLRDGHIKWANFDESALADIGDPVSANEKRWSKATKHLLRELPLGDQ